MLIGVLSDTHIRKGRTLPSLVWNYLLGVDLILHAGDILTKELLTDLGTIAPVYAVKGNCDGWELSYLPEKNVVECEGFNIGLIHGNLGRGINTPDRAFKTFESYKNIDIIVFGHSHVPFSQYRKGILMFNPGSSTDKRREPLNSIGMIDIENGKIIARHIYF